MNQTPNYALPSWEATDRILMEDFNDAFETIDTQMKARNCQFYMISYTGTGSGARTFTFPHKPMLVIIMGGGTETWMCGIQGVPYMFLNYLTNGFSSEAAWSGNTLTWQHNPGGAIYSANGEGRVYTLLALLDADQ